MSTPILDTLNTDAYFNLLAEGDPSTLPRVLELFALNGLIPRSVNARTSRKGRQLITICCAGLSDSKANVIAAKLAEQVLVQSVGLEMMLPARRAA